MTPGNQPSQHDMHSDTGQAARVVVGIGTASGGIELLQQFLQALPEQCGLAFVVIQAAGADYRGMLTELLGRHSSLRLTTVDAPVVPRPDTLYLVRPRQHLLMQHGRLMPALPDAGPDAGPINSFFSSLARQQGGNAVAILLGNTGTDGGLGMLEVEAAGGKVLVAGAGATAGPEEQQRAMRELLQEFRQVLGRKDNTPALPADPHARLAHVYDLLLARYGTPAVLIDESRQVLHSFGKTNRYLHLPEGRMSNDLTLMLDGNLKTAVNTLIHSAFRRQQDTVLKHIQTSEDSGEFVDLRAELLLENGGNARFLLIHFDTAPIHSDRSAELERLRERNAALRQRIVELESEPPPSEHTAVPRADGTPPPLSDDHFRRMADASPVLFLIANAEGRLTWVNHTWRTWTGRSLELERSGDWLDHVHPDDRPHLEAGLNRQVQHGEDLALEYRLRNAQGGYGWVWHQASALRGAQGEIEGFIATCTDITWQKERSEEQQRIERKLEETARLDSLGLMAGGVAHDFNNLLTGILGNIELAQWETTADQEMLKTVLHDARSATLRAADLCKQMLAYSGKGQFISENCNVNLLVRETLRFIQSSIKHEVKVFTELDDQMPLILADKVQLQQVVMNLTINAGESIPERGNLWIRTGRTRLELEMPGSLFGDDSASSGPAIFLEVEDTGIGMTPEEVKKAFEPFYSTKFIGRGLGLSAVQGIIKGHHGHLTVDSIKGKGTLMRVVLPLRQPGMPEPKPDAPRERQSWINRVLIVDDEEIVARILQRYLDHMAIEADYVLSGKECVSRFQKDPDRYDLVLLDLTMGGMDGYETFQQLRRFNPNVQVILISGFTEKEATRHFDAEDLAGFLPKPISERTLVDMITRLQKLQ